LSPLEGALEFLNTLRSKTQVIILSDTFTEFAAPLMAKLNYPTLFCNHLVVDDDNMIIDYKLRQNDGKLKAVEALQSIGFTVLAAGENQTVWQRADRLPMAVQNLFCLSRQHRIA
jgi:phosphoserine/homoserine phosphotransferase